MCLAGCWCPPSLPSFWLEYPALSVQFNTSFVPCQVIYLASYIVARALPGGSLDQGHSM